MLLFFIADILQHSKLQLKGKNSVWWSI